MAPGVLVLFTSIAGAILSAATALIILDIGTRSPGQVLADAITASRSAYAVIRGLIRILISLFFAGISVALTFSALPAIEFDRYTIYQIGVFLAALAVELLIGDQVRTLLGVRKGTRAG